MDKYTIEEKLGKGSFATVWRGRHKHTGENVAIKVISRQTVQATAQLTQEVAFLKRIQHQNIVRFIDLKETKKHYYLLLEYCDGGDLSNLIEKTACMNERAAQTYLKQVANGLQELHRHNFIHRDLKPQNILLFSSNNAYQLKIADFGFSRSLQPSHMAATVCGSPYYMAPEILRFEPYDSKADLWSVGTILYELVTGTLPFQGDNPFDLLQNIEKANGVTIPPNLQLSLECADLLHRLLTIKPSDRISSEDFFIHPFINVASRLSIMPLTTLHGPLSQEPCSASDTLSENSERFTDTLRTEKASSVLSNVLPKHFSNFIERLAANGGPCLFTFRLDNTLEESAFEGFEHSDSLQFQSSHELNHLEQTESLLHCDPLNRMPPTVASSKHPFEMDKQPSNSASRHHQTALQGSFPPVAPTYSTAPQWIMKQYETDEKNALVDTTQSSGLSDTVLSSISYSLASALSRISRQSISPIRVFGSLTSVFQNTAAAVGTPSPTSEGSLWEVTDETEEEFVIVDEADSVVPCEIPHTHVSIPELHNLLPIDSQRKPTHLCSGAVCPYESYAPHNTHYPSIEAYTVATNSVLQQSTEALFGASTQPEQYPSPNTDLAPQWTQHHSKSTSDALNSAKEEAAPTAEAQTTIEETTAHTRNEEEAHCLTSLLSPPLSTGTFSYVGNLITIAVELATLAEEYAFAAVSTHELTGLSAVDPQRTELPHSTASHTDFFAAATGARDPSITLKNQLNSPFINAFGLILKALALFHKAISATTDPLRLFLCITLQATQPQTL